MAQTIQPAPDWFDSLWAQYESKLPIYLRNEATKKVARIFLDEAIQMIGAYSRTEKGVAQIVAYARIAAIVKGIGAVSNAPDPSPEQVAEAVQKIVDKLKERSAQQ